ncbi:hypothetical protein BGZ70_006919 [Mortierella alpina]|uniref:Uncharacterized protein n=1 Tax=Mortierella alpina TaxID=64518 RepID=A0A9P6J7M4_MORAP|nr:hypothetical protein BGZ70_006919 [Mortierella alpina]
MVFSTPQSTVMMTLFFIIATIGSFTSALPTDPTTNITLSFFTVNSDPVPTPGASIISQSNRCIAIPSLANSFSSNSNQSIFAIYKDDSCQSYLYSVEVLLANLHGAKGLMWMGDSPAPTHTQGETFTDPAMANIADTDRRANLTKIAVIATSAGVVFILLGIYLCYTDNRRNQRRGGTVPEPHSPTGHRNMAEVSGPGRSVYQYNSHYRNGSSASSNISYLPPYGSETYYTKSAQAGHDIKTPEEARVATSPIQKQAAPGWEKWLRVPPVSRYDAPTSRARSFSNLTNQVGTGAGLDPGTVPQGRNAGFGLGYDLEENKKRDSRRDSDSLMRDAMMTPPHSPNMRPSSVMSDDNGQFLGRGNAMLDPTTTTIRISA